MSTLAEVNEGAGQPFVAQKVINYCLTVCAQACAVTIALICIVFVFVSWIENLHKGLSLPLVLISLTPFLKF